MNQPGDKIYHITRREQWEEAARQGVYRGDTLDSQGFIHASTRLQVTATGNRYYAGQHGLVLLEIDPARVAPEIRYEAAPSGELFPHIYGPLDAHAVLRVGTFEPGPDGMFAWPADLG